MNKYFIAAGALGLSAATAYAGGIERSNQSVGVLFEEGRYLQLSLGHVSPDVSGSVLPAFAGSLGLDSGNMVDSYLNFGAAYKADINDTWSYAIILDQPYGADVDYPVTPTYFASGSTAEFNSTALTGILQYNLPSNVSFYGGVRLQNVEAEANIPFVAGYEASADRSFGVGYLLGAAYERPDIALRVALTYYSKVDHDLDTTESSVSLLGGPNESTTPIETPQAVNLEFQTGIAKDTLLFGSVRWVNWSDFDITPDDYFALTSGGSLVSYEDDRTTYTLGVGRRLTDKWSVAGSISHEPSTGSIVSNLGPTDGFTSLGLAAIYTEGNMEITTGIRYVWVGDAETEVGAASPATEFEDNEAFGIGVQVGFKF